MLLTLMICTAEKMEIVTWPSSHILPTPEDSLRGVMDGILKHKHSVNKEMNAFKEKKGWGYHLINIYKYIT